MGKVPIRAAILSAPLALLAGAAQAADPAFCQDYAQAAVNQVTLALSVGSCSPGAHGPRWSPDQQYHMKWCLMQSPAAATKERANRTGFIRSCRGY